MITITMSQCMLLPWLPSAADSKKTKKPQTDKTQRLSPYMGIILLKILTLPVFKYILNY